MSRPYLTQSKGVAAPFKGHPAVKPIAPPAKPYAKTWSTPIRNADMERLLERLDRIIRDVEQVADAIAEKLGLESAGRVLHVLN